MTTKEKEKERVIRAVEHSKKTLYVQPNKCGDNVFFLGTIEETKELFKNEQESFEEEERITFEKWFEDCIQEAIGWLSGRYLNVNWVRYMGENESICKECGHRFDFEAEIENVAVLEEDEKYLNDYKKDKMLCLDCFIEKSKN